MWNTGQIAGIQGDGTTTVALSDPFGNALDPLTAGLTGGTLVLSNGNTYTISSVNV